MKTIDHISLRFEDNDSFHTGWLRCQAAGPDLRIRRGWVSSEGWSFYLSDVGDLLHSLPGLQSTHEEVSMSRDAFLRSISESAADSKR